MDHPRVDVDDGGGVCAGGCGSGDVAEERGRGEEAQAGGVSGEIAGGE